MSLDDETARTAEKLYDAQTCGGVAFNFPHPLWDEPEPVQDHYRSLAEEHERSTRAHREDR